MARFLLDEDTKAELATHLEKDGHDAARVVTVDALGRGSDDDAVMAYAHSTDRTIVTHDDDFVDPGLADQHAGVFYIPSQRLDPFQEFAIVRAVLGAAPPDELPPVVYLTPEWL
jgi:hypothetical protein